MKKNFLLAATFFTVIGMQAVEEYDLRVLSFEDQDVQSGFSALPDTATCWSSLIDTVQYGGVLLYTSTGMGSAEEYYAWTDGGNTFLSSHLISNWGAYCYWNGGEAVSHYCSADSVTYGSSVTQLTVYQRTDMSLRYQGGGHENSDNFCIHTGNRSSAPYAPCLVFADSTARVIDHVWITNTAYIVNVIRNGNAYAKKFDTTDWLRIEAYGYTHRSDTVACDTAICYLAQGKDIVTEWTKFDLSTLGSIMKLELNVTGSDMGTFGLNTPAYFAWDDMAVRFPKSTEGVDDIATPLTTRKMIRDGHILILRDGILYDMMGHIY